MRPYSAAEFLAPAGVAALEAKAYEDGHSAGYENVYCVLQGLAELAETLVKNAKTKGA